MKKRKIVNGTVAILLTAAMSGCGSSGTDEKLLIGSWTLNKENSTISTDAKYLTFYEGGGCANSGESGTWTVSGSTLQVLGTYGGQFFSHDNLMGTFEVDGDELVISNPSVDGDVKQGELVYEKTED
ncbi:MAG: hypothetical protein ACI4JB_10475 [Porcipelethomonas sp.]